jgi:hypothetical protein
MMFFNDMSCTIVMAVKVASFNDAITFVLSFHKAENRPIITDLNITKMFLT